MQETKAHHPELTGVLEAGLYVPDLDAAARFYGQILGLEEIARVPGRHVFFRCGPTIVLLFVAERTERPATNPALPVPTHGAHGQGHLCFAATADELDQWARHLPRAGVPVEADFLWPNGARSLYVRDPAGNSIEFAEPKLWTKAA